MATGIARRFEGGQGTIVEPRQERAGIIDADFLHLAGQVMLALLDEGFSQARDGIDFREHVLRSAEEIDFVRVEPRQRSSGAVSYVAGWPQDGDDL